MVVWPTRLETGQTNSGHCRRRCANCRADTLGVYQFVRLIIASLIDNQMSKRWYVVQAFSGYEKSVMRSLQEQIAPHSMEERFGTFLFRTEEVVEMREGKKRKSERKFEPGYVLVNMEMDETWHLVKSVPRVLGFVGGTADRPAPITDAEAALILDRVTEGGEYQGRRRCLSQAVGARDRWSVC